MSHKDDHPFPGARKAQYYGGFKDLAFADFPCRNVHYRIHRGRVTRMGTVCPILCSKCGKSITKYRLHWMPVCKEGGEFTRRKIGHPVPIFNRTSTVWVFKHVNCTTRTQVDDVWSTDGALSDDDSSVSSGMAMSHNAARGSIGAIGSGGANPAISSSSGVFDPQRTRRVPLHDLAWHPLNRGGQGVMPLHAHTTARDIYAASFLNCGLIMSGPFAGHDLSKIRIRKRLPTADMNEEDEDGFCIYCRKCGHNYKNRGESCKCGKKVVENKYVDTNYVAQGTLQPPQREH